MKRRAFLLSLSALPLLAKGDKIPTDPVELNAFTLQYNVYLESVRQRVIDIRQWPRVKQAWDRMTR